MAPVRPFLSEDEARAKLLQLVAERGSQQAVAKLAGVCESFVSSVMCGHQPIGRRLAAALGLIGVPIRAYQYLPKAAEEDVR